MGKSTMHGAAKTHRAVLAAHPQAGDAQIEFLEPPMSWEIGDAIVIAGTEAETPKAMSSAPFQGLMVKL